MTFAAIFIKCIKWMAIGSCTWNDGRRLTQETVKESVLPTLTRGYGYVKLLKADHSDTSKFGTQNGELHFVSKCI